MEELDVEVACYGKIHLDITFGGSFLHLLIQKMLERVLLNKGGVEYIVYDRGAQNPLTTTAEEGAALAAKTGCEVIVGLNP